MKQLVVGLLVLMLAPMVSAEEWSTYRSDKFGFSMLIPQGLAPHDKDFGDGWAGIYARQGGIELYGVAKLGIQESPEKIESLGISLSQISREKWKKVDQGRKINGWKWWRTYRASNQKMVVYAVLGTGKKGSYLLFLKTTVGDFKVNEKSYTKWYTSLRVD